MVRLSRWISALVATLLIFGSGGAFAQGRPMSGPGQTCGGIAGLQCQSGLACVMRGPRVADQAGVCQAPRGGGGVMCPAIFQPVCGVDGKTYSNRCVADRAGATVAHTGQCGVVPPRPQPPRVCSEIYRPVCGVNGETYPNRCIARASGVGVRHPGQCRDHGYGGPQGGDQPPSYGLPPQPVPYGSYQPSAPPTYAPPPRPRQPYGERG